VPKGGAEERGTGRIDTVEISTRVTKPFTLKKDDGRTGGKFEKGNHLGNMTVQSFEKKPGQSPRGKKTGGKKRKRATVHWKSARENGTEHSRKRGGQR